PAPPPSHPRRGPGPPRARVAPPARPTRSPKDPASPRRLAARRGPRDPAGPRSRAGADAAADRVRPTRAEHARRGSGRPGDEGRSVRGSGADPLPRPVGPARSRPSPPPPGPPSSEDQVVDQAGITHERG